MENQANNGGIIKGNISSIPNIVVKVVANPVEFFKQMPKTGGVVAPFIFMVAMGVVAGIVGAILGIFGLGFAGSFLMALLSIIILPVLVAVFGFIGAAVFFVIWKIMGSPESFETAYRCVAYTGAISPIIALLNGIPYVGAVLGLVYMTYLIVVASTEVHSIKPKTSWLVFGIICAVFSIISVSTEYAGRRVAREIGTWEKRIEKEVEKLEDMTPEEVGRAVGELLKGLQEEAEKE